MEIALVQLLISGILGLFPTIPNGVATFVAAVVQRLPALVAAGTDIKAFVDDQLTRVRLMIDENRDPTQAEWDDLRAIVAAELANLNAQATSQP